MRARVLRVIPSSRALRDLLPPLRRRQSAISRRSQRSGHLRQGLLQGLARQAVLRFGLRGLRPFRASRHGAQQDELVDQVLQLAGVSGPLLDLQGGEGLGAHRRLRAQVALGELLQEMAGQQLDVLAPLAQRGQVQRHDVDPVEQVLAEAARADQGGQVLVGGGDDAHVHRDALGPADPLEGAFLDHPQDLGLGFQGHVPDLVQEQGAPVGQLELAPAPLHRSGEGAPLVAEQLGEQQALREGGAVQADEAGLGPVAGEMDVAGQHLLAGAAFPRDQHRGVAVLDLVRFGQQGQQGRSRG